MMLAQPCEKLIQSIRGNATTSFESLTHGKWHICGAVEHVPWPFS